MKTGSEWTAAFAAALVRENECLAPESIEEISLPRRKRFDDEPSRETLIRQIAELKVTNATLEKRLDHLQNTNQRQHMEAVALYERIADLQLEIQRLEAEKFCQRTKAKMKRRRISQHE